MENIKILSIAALLLAVFLIPSYGYESITISPKYIYNDTSKVVLQYKYKNEYYDTYHFTLIINSSGIAFENTTVYIPHIERNKLLTLNITGRIVSYNQSYPVILYKRYLLDGTEISGVHILEVYRSYNRSTQLEEEKIKENITVEINESVEEVVNKTTSPTTVENISPELSVNISEEKEESTKWEENISEERENLSLYSESEGKTTPDIYDYIFYILIGIFTGIVMGIIAVYILSL